jgi:peptide-methionine (R)-S-oxide reductase
LLTSEGIKFEIVCHNTYEFTGEIIMQRRLFIAGAIASAATLVASRGVFATSDSAAMTGDFPTISKSKDEWRKLLGEQQYQVLFEESTEGPWTSPLNDEKRAGTYICSACFLPMFSSETKFDSGTGWPSFYQAIAANVGTRRDWKLILPRTEYHCARCGGHQGHVFEDGPEPTGQRWCNNGVALQFVADGESLPELRV